MKFPSFPQAWPSLGGYGGLSLNRRHFHYVSLFAGCGAPAPRTTESGDAELAGAAVAQEVPLTQGAFSHIALGTAL